MGKLYWTLVVFVVVTGLGVVIFFGLQGKTVPKIKWSHFADAQEVADSVQLRLSQELKSYDIVFLGPHPEKPLHMQSALKIMEWLKSSQPSVVIVDPALLDKNQIPYDVSLSLMSDRERFFEGISKMDKSHKVIVLAPNLYVTHILSQSPIRQMENQLKNYKYVSLTFMNFPANRDAEKEFEFPCNTTDESAVGLSELGCFLRLQSRQFYGKKPIENKTPGFLNQVRTPEFMFFLGH